MSCLAMISKDRYLLLDATSWCTTYVSNRQIGPHTQAQKKQTYPLQLSLDASSVPTSPHEDYKIRTLFTSLLQSSLFNLLFLFESFIIFALLFLLLLWSLQNKVRAPTLVTAGTGMTGPDLQGFDFTTCSAGHVHKITSLIETNGKEKSEKEAVGGTEQRLKLL